VNMGKTASVKYLGELRAEATHLKSGRTILTDAPTDNNGKGEAFSPTDLVATALANCMITVMGIRARKEGFDLEGTSAEVTKIMASSPRRIAEVGVLIKLKDNCSNDMKKVLEEIGLNCPVAKSLHPNLKQNISFEWY